MAKKTNIGIVGAGYWGPNLLRNFRSLSECNVKIVCDFDKDKLARIRELYPEVHTTTEFRHLTEDKDIHAIVVATPVSMHFELAKKSLLAGKYTLVEKPMASSSDECRELIETSERQNLTLMVDHTYIYSTPVRMIKKIVDSGDIGELMYISSKRLNLGLFQKDINVAWDLAVHDIAIILYITGALPASVNCQGKAHIIPNIEDVTNMSLYFPGGGFATIHNSWLDPNKVRTMTFVGSKKMLLYDDLEPVETIKLYDKRVEPPPHYDTFADFHYSYGDVYSPHLNQVEPLKVLCQRFLECIGSGLRSESSGLDGLRVVQILDAATLSLKSKGSNIDINWEGDMAKDFSISLWGSGGDPFPVSDRSSKGEEEIVNAKNLT